MSKKKTPNFFTKKQRISVLSVFEDNYHSHAKNKSHTPWSTTVFSSSVVPYLQHQWATGRLRGPRWRRDSRSDREQLPHGACTNPKTHRLVMQYMNCHCLWNDNRDVFNVQLFYLGSFQSNSKRAVVAILALIYDNLFSETVLNVRFFEYWYDILNDYNGSNWYVNAPHRQWLPRPLSLFYHFSEFPSG